MAYTVANTFSAAAVIASADLQENLDDMKKYVDGTAVVGDLQTSPAWVGARHLVRGTYNAITNQYAMTSGVTGGFASHDDDFAYLGDGPTARLDPANPERVAYPNTGSTFYLESAADVLFQFHSHPVSPNIATAFGVSRLYVALDGNHLDNTKQWTTNYQIASQHRYRRQNWWHGFYLTKNLAAGWHDVQLVGYTTANFVYLKNWSMSLEAYYL